LALFQKNCIKTGFDLYSLETPHQIIREVHPIFKVGTTQIIDHMPFSKHGVV